jgi:hypothetical protein
MAEEEHTIIDPVQLKRIESIHGGFYYQHVYAVACLLSAQEMGMISLLVEKDEDIELRLDDRYAYIQVKTRSRPLQKSDIDGALKRFSQLRELHNNHQRPLVPRFRIVSNISPGPRLLKEIYSPEWLGDVILVWPGVESQDDLGIPPAWSDPVDATVWCAEKAEKIPYTTLAGDTLTYKLAAIVQLACTGSPPYENHELSSRDLPDLFEQFIFQLQGFPEPPTNYRPLISEPVIEAGQNVRLITGMTGAGKTSWASQLALHQGSLVIYFAIGHIPNESIPATLAREIAGRLARDDRSVLGSMLLPGVTGLDSLQYLSKYLAEHNISLTLIIDDVQNAAVEEIVKIVRLATDIKFVLLSRLTDDIPVYEAYLGIQSERLKGWALEEIALEFASQGCPIDPELSNQISRLTGGLPLFVQNAATISREIYGGDVKTFCNDLWSEKNITPVAQELILQKVFETLNEDERNSIAILSIPDISLSREEGKELLQKILGVGESTYYPLIRKFNGLGVINVLQGGSMTLHDAYRLLGRNQLKQLPPELRNYAYLVLREVIEPSVINGANPSRVPLFLKLLPLTGEVRTLVDLSSFEIFYELGYANHLYDVLEEIGRDPNMEPDDRFWALDSLAYWDLQSDNHELCEKRLAVMQEITTKFEPDIRAITNYYSKRMLLYGKQGNLRQARRSFYKIRLGELEDDHKRIVKYNLAAVLYHSEVYQESERILVDLIPEYYEALGLELEDVMFKNPPEIQEKLRDQENTLDNLKRLADCLDLYARVRIAQELPFNLARWHALKFYDMSHSVTSLIRTGQDIIEDFLGLLDDPNGARAFIENTLLPIIHKYKLLSYLVPVLGQYAVVLAYCGEIEDAFKQIRTARAYIDAMPQAIQADINRQEQIIKMIARRISG